MKLLSYAGVAFSTLNVGASLENDTPDRERNPDVAERVGAAGLITGMLGGAREIPVYFQVKPGNNIEETILALIAALDADHPDARTLVGQLNDGATNVQVTARVGSYVARPGDTKGLLVPFWTDDERWAASSASMDGPTSFAAAGSRTFTVDGQGRVSPLITLTWSGPRPSPTSTIGWRYVRQIAVANNGNTTLADVALQLGPFDHAALVSADKSQADGDDLVIFNDRGERLRRTVVAPNTKACFLWFAVDFVPPGTSRTYDVAYGNSAATHDLTNNGFPYSYQKSPAIDISGASGTASAATSSTLTTALTADDTTEWVGATLIIWDGTGRWQYRRVESHTSGANMVVTVDRNFSVTPDNTSKFAVIRSGYAATGGIVSSATSTTLIDDSTNLRLNSMIGATVETYDTSVDAVPITSGTVTGNTDTSLTVAFWSAGTPTVGHRWRVTKPNGKLIWYVAQTSRDNNNHRGRYRLNRGQTRPSNVWTRVDGVPGAWEFTTYNPGQAVFSQNQPRIFEFDVGGGDLDYFAILNARIARKEYPGRLPELGRANGLRFSHPLPLLGVRHDFQIQNPGGMAKAVFGSREQGGEDWEVYKTYSTTHSTLTAQAVAYYDLSAASPLHLLAAITSIDDADVPDTKLGTANLRDGDVLEAYVDTRTLSVTDLATATEVDVYDYCLTLRRGGASEAAGDDVVRVGGVDRHVWLAATEELRIGKQGDVPLAYRIYTTASGTLVRDLGRHVRLYHVEANASGVATRYLSSRVLPLVAGSNTFYVSDEDGNLGIVGVNLTYEPGYL